MSLDLNAIKARADAALRGPWYTDGYGNVVAEQGDLLSDTPDAELTAEFVAHAREDIPALLAEVRRLSGLLQSTYDALIQGGQTYYIRWKDAMTVLEGRKPGGVS